MLADEWVYTQLDESRPVMECRVSNEQMRDTKLAAAAAATGGKNGSGEARARATAIEREMETETAWLE